MTSKAEFTEQWSENTPEERRARLNELGAIDPNTKTDDELREHDALATMVAEDEETALRAQGEES